MTVEALAAKKDVYLEKPMSYSIEDGLAILDAASASDRIVQVGSQGVSGADMAKARELVKAGRIGQVDDGARRLQPQQRRRRMAVSDSARRRARRR